jgi:hypothetical protein
MVPADIWLLTVYTKSQYVLTYNESTSSLLFLNKKLIGSFI